MEGSIAKNAIFNVLYKALSVVFPLVIVSYASRILGASGIGIVSSAQNFVTYFSIFAALGIPSYGVRLISQTKKDPEKCNRSFTELFVINLFSTLTCTVLYFILLNVLNIKTTVLNYIFSTLIILNVFNIDWLYEGFEKYDYIAIRSLIVKGISLVLLFWLVKDKQDIAMYALIVCFGTAGNYILNMFSLNKYVHFQFADLNLKQHMKVIIAFFGSVIAIEIYSLVDVSMLTYYTNSEVVGWYSNASKIVKMLANTITAIGAVMLPRLSFCFMEHRTKDIRKITVNFLDATLTIALPASVGICLVAKDIVLLLFGSEFLPSVSTIIILSPLIILMPLSGGIFGQLLLTSENENKYLLCVGAGTIVNCILNYFFIKTMSYNGAALASVITELIVNIAMIIYSSKIIRLKINIKGILKALIGTVMMFVFVYLIQKFILSKVVISVVASLLIKILVAVLVYFAVLFILKQKFLMSILHKFGTIK